MTRSEEDWDRELAALEDLDDRATKGPWFQWTQAGDVSSLPEDSIIMMTTKTHEVDLPGVGVVTRATPQGDVDCQYVACVRTLLPDLLKYVKTLRGK